MKDKNTKVTFSAGLSVDTLHVDTEWLDRNGVIRVSRVSLGAREWVYVGTSVWDTGLQVWVNGRRIP